MHTPTLVVVRLPFDRGVARAHAGIAAARPRRGRPIAQVDYQITAIARARGMAVATRNIRDFEDMGIELYTTPGMVHEAERRKPSPA